MSDDRERRPRRSPRTRASEEIVAAILGAAEELIVREGISSMTTNRIAERAGVSVGSVYRYFPDKESIVAEIGRRLRKRNAEHLVALVKAGGPLEVMIRDVIESFVFLEREGDFALRQTLTNEVPPAWLRTAAEDAWNTAESVIASLLRERFPSLEEREAGLRAFVVVHAVEGVVRDATLRLNPLEGEAIVSELITLVTPYLSA